MKNKKFIKLESDVVKLFQEINSHWDIVRSFCSKRNKRRNLKFTSDFSDDRSTEYHLSLNKLQTARFKTHIIYESWSCVKHIQTDSERKVIAEKAIIRRLLNHLTFSSIDLLFFDILLIPERRDTQEKQLSTSNNYKRRQTK